MTSLTCCIAVKWRWTFLTTASPSFRAEIGARHRALRLARTSILFYVLHSVPAAVRTHVLVNNRLHGVVHFVLRGGDSYAFSAQAARLLS